MRSRLVLLAVACIVLAGVAHVVDGQADFDDRRQWQDDQYPGNKQRPYCPPDSKWSCWEPPYYPYDAIERRISNIGTVVGRSLIYAPYRYLNIFLGVPYARPPFDRLRFKVIVTTLVSRTYIDVFIVNANGAI